MSGFDEKPVRRSLLPKQLRLEEVKKLALQNKTEQEIAAILHVSERTVRRDLAKIKGRTIQDAKDTPELIWSVKGSYEQRLTILKKAHDILDSPPIMTKDGRQVDDRFLKLQAIRVIDEIAASLDKIFGVDDIDTRKQLDRLNEQLEHLERIVQGRGKISEPKGSSSAKPRRPQPSPL